MDACTLRPGLTALLALCPLLGWAPLGAQSAGLMGNEPDGTIYDVDPATGAATNPRATGINYLVDIAPDGAGQLLGLTTFGSDPPNSLVRIDPATGSWTLIGATGLEDLFEGDLANDPVTGRLFGAQNYDSIGNLYEIFEIDRNTGVATVTGHVVGAGDLSAMAFDASGTLYVIDTDLDALLTVDPETAAVLDSVPLSTFLGTGAGMDFDPFTGILYVADGGSLGTDTLYTLDPATGTLTTRGPLGLTNGFSGLTFPAPPLFADGFETGDTSRWSAIVP